MNKIRLTREGNDFTCYCWNSDTKVYDNLVRYDLSGDFDIQFNFMRVRKKWYERLWININNLWK